MLHTIYYIIISHFILGGLLLMIINKKNNAYKAKSRWTKYVYYLLIVQGTILSIAYSLFFPLSILILLIGGYELFKINTIKKKDLYITYFIYILIGVLFLLFAKYVSIRWQLFVYTIIFIFDGFAQIIGQLIGKRRVFPYLSPQKTLEGIIGAFICTILTSTLIYSYLKIDFLTNIIITTIIIAAGIGGDLLASYIKRRNQVKDFSQLIPGNGGVLDRYDSLILAGALAYLMIEMIQH